jgi:hypothetical protein
MRARSSLLAAALAAAFAAPACAQILGVEVLPAATDAGGGAGSGGSLEAGASDVADAPDTTETWVPSPCDCSATEDWSKAFSTSGDVTIAGVAVDSANRIVVAGSVTGMLDIAGHPLAGGADRDVFVIVLGTCGELVWSRRFGGAGDQTALALALDPPSSAAPDAIVISGWFTGSLDFGGATAPLTAPSQRAFIARLDPVTGDGIASFATGSDAAMKYQGTAVAVAADGNTFWAGTEDSGANLFLRRLDPALSVTSQITPTCTECDPVLALLPGGVALAGRLQGSVDFAPGGPGPISSNGSTDIYAATLTPQSTAFAEGKSKVFGDTAAQLAAGVAADATGNVFLAGSFAGTLNMGGGGKTKVSSGGLDAFVAKLDATLAPQWLAAFGGGGLAADQRAHAVAVGQRLAVAGDFVGALEIGADAGASLASAGDVDAFLLILDPATGAPLHAASFGSAGADHAAAVALDGSSHAVVAGVLAGPATLDCGVIGGSEKSMFVARRTIP